MKDSTNTQQSKELAPKSSFAKYRHLFMTLLMGAGVIFANCGPGYGKEVAANCRLKRKEGGTTALKNCRLKVFFYLDEFGNQPGDEPVLAYTVTGVKCDQVAGGQTYSVECKEEKKNPNADDGQMNNVPFSAGSCHTDGQGAAHVEQDGVVCSFTTQKQK